MIKSISILLLLLFLTALLLPVVQYVSIAGHRRNIHAKISSTVDNNLIKIPLSEYKTKYKGNKELMIGRKNFDFVKSENNMVYLWEDKKEATLYALFKKITKPFHTLNCLKIFCLFLGLIMAFTFKHRLSWSIISLNKFRGLCYTDGHLNCAFQPPEMAFIH